MTRSAIHWADFGDPEQANSQDMNYAFVSGTELQVIAPQQTQTVDPATVPFSVKTLGGQSNSLTALYAGIPTVSGVVNTADSTELNGVSGGPDTGGTPITITGQGFAEQLVAPLQFVDTTKKGTSHGTRYESDLVRRGRWRNCPGHRADRRELLHRGATQPNHRELHLRSMTER